jgi:transcriptional regulator with XRE-family HTH domain
MTKLPTPPTVPGSTLKRLRQEAGYTQQAFADKLKRSRTAVAAWEYGRAMSLRSRADVAKVLKVDPAVLGPPWDPAAARPQYKRRQRQEAAFMSQLRDLAAPPTAAGGVVDAGYDTGVTSSAPARGGETLQDIPDGDQFERLIGFWRAMPAAKRPALVRAAWELSSPEVVPAAASEARGKKSQG